MSKYTVQIMTLFDYLHEDDQALIFQLVKRLARDINCPATKNYCDDYTAERSQWLDSVTLDDVFANIEARQDTR